MYLEIETVSVVEAGKRLGLGKTGAYQAIAAGEISHRHFGHRFLMQASNHRHHVQLLAHAATIMSEP